MDLPYRAKHGASYVKNQPWTIILTETQTFVLYEIVNLKSKQISIDYDTGVQVLVDKPTSGDSNTNNWDTIILRT